MVRDWMEFITVALLGYTKSTYPVLGTCVEIVSWACGWN